MKILAFGAHPDDIEYYAGGTLAKMASEGNELVFVVATDGRNGTHKRVDPKLVAKTRKREQDKAAKSIGAQKVVYLNYHDGELESRLKRLKRDLLQILLKERPEIVFTFDPQKQYVVHEDFHPDHRALAVATVDVVMIDSTLPIKTKTPLEKPKLYLYNSYQTNTIVDITDHLEKKTVALKTHRSQGDVLILPNTCFEEFQVYTSNKSEKL